MKHHKLMNTQHIPERYYSGKPHSIWDSIIGKWISVKVDNKVHKDNNN